MIVVTLIFHQAMCRLEKRHNHFKSYEIYKNINADLIYANFTNTKLTSADKASDIYIYIFIDGI